MSSFSQQSVQGIGLLAMFTHPVLSHSSTKSMFFSAGCTVTHIMGLLLCGCTVFIREESGKDGGGKTGWEDGDGGEEGGDGKGLGREVDNQEKKRCMRKGGVGGDRVARGGRREPD